MKVPILKTIKLTPFTAFLLLAPVFVMNDFWDCFKNINPGQYYQTPVDDCPAWDTDCDEISNATEGNSANYYLSLDPDVANDNPSIAHGSPCNGWLENGLNLVNSGTGYFHYNPEKGGSETRIDTDDWGVLHLINMIEGAGRDWQDLNCVPPRMAVGDLSLRNGGTWSDHACHQNGLAVDIRYVRNDGLEASLDIADSAQMGLFDEAKTRDLITFLIDNGNIESIYVDLANSELEDLGYDCIEHKSGHSNHFHVLIRDPDGTGN